MTTDQGTPTMTTRMTDIELSELLGVTNVQVNRIRHGQRGPSLDLMVRIADVFRWSLADQAVARTAGKYAEGFEAASARYAAARNTDVGPGEHSPTPLTD